MKRVGKILEKVIKDLGIYKRFNEQKSLLYWNESVGDRISGKTKPLYAKNGKLIVEVENNVWMNELSFLKPEIIKKINQKIGSNAIDDILFFLKRG
ncbi:MAG: hypothetical protein B5M53_08540 [Candidatus Cloacimonas sp. 4484_209]|nr:MAG: hypothetical protein B5M53_08540 [Candidatus Cloacimonas sp. 4484_209]